MIESLISIFQGIGGFIVFLIGFSFLIFVHELGHFLVARSVGIRCTQFAVGMGNAVCSYRKGMGVRFGSTEPKYNKQIAEWIEAHESELNDLPDYERHARAEQALGLGETEYRLSSLPLGGYVKMVGQEDLDPAARSNDPRAYNSKPVWARMCVISAGVIMNMIFAFIFFVIAFMIGVNFPPAQVGDVAADMPAAITYADGHDGDDQYQGLKPADRITHVDGEETLDFTDVMIAAALGSEDEATVLTIQRDGEPEPLTYRMKPVMLEQFNAPPLLAFGIARPLSLEMVTPEGHKELKPQLAKHGVKPGMMITHVGEQPVSQFYEYNNIITAAQGQPVNVTFTNPTTGEQAVAPVSAVAIPPFDNEGMSNLLGMVPVTQVMYVEPGSPAEKAGLLVDDLLVQVGARQWPSYREISEIVQASGRTPIALTVMRQGVELQINPVTPNRKGLIGISPFPATHTNLVSTTLDNSPTAALLTPGSKITEFNGQPISSFADLQRALQNLIHDQPDQREITLGFALNVAGQPTETHTIAIDDAQIAALASASWNQPLDVTQLEVPIRATGPIHAATLGVRKTQQIVVQTYITLMRLVQGKLSIKHLNGPVGIARIGTIIANNHGVTYTLFFLGMISVNLAVINFLPFPIVDGGHMVLLIIEKIKGSPVSPQIQAAVTYVGLAAIAVVFLMVTFNDIRNWIGI